MRPWVIGLALIVVASSAVYAAITRTNQVADRDGEYAAACGPVTSAHVALQSRGEPVFLTLGHAYADQDLTIVVLSDDHAGLGVPDALIGRQACVSGRIQHFFGKPRMLLGSPSDITFRS